MTKINNQKLNQTSGVAFVGMAIVTVLFAAIIFATIYIGLFSISKSMMEAGIGRAMDLAVIDPRFSEDAPAECTGEMSLGACCVQDTVPEDHDWCMAYGDIRNEALKIPTSSVVQTTVKSGFAYINPNFTADSPFTMHVPYTLNERKDKPITMKTFYSYRDLPFGEWSDKGTVRNFAFYEVSSKPVYNVPSDCFGIPQHAPGFNGQDCNQCPTDANQASAIVNGVKRCYPCSALAPLASATADSNHDPDKKYPYSLCYCPTAAYCNSLYNEGNPLSMAVSSYCECICASSQGMQTDSNTGRCICKDTPEPYYEHEFTGGRDGQCDCSPPVTQAVCDTAFGVGTMVPSSDGCTCACDRTGENACVNGNPVGSNCDCNCRGGWVDDSASDGEGRCSLCPGSVQVDCLATGGTYDAGNCRCIPNCGTVNNSFYDPASNTCNCICGGNIPNCTDCGGITGE